MKRSYIAKLVTTSREFWIKRSDVVKPRESVPHYVVVRRLRGLAAKVRASLNEPVVIVFLR